MTNMIARHTHSGDTQSGRQRDLPEDVERRGLDQRSDRPTDVHDEMERTDRDLSENVGFALIQVKAEMMSRIDTALSRLEAGEYGRCFGCGVEIADTRLRALPFAVRCKTCDEKREQGHARLVRHA